MSIEVICPTCGAKLKAPEAAIGKRAKCAKCRNPVLVTAPTTAPSTPPQSGGEPETFPTLSESENPFDFGASPLTSPPRTSVSPPPPSRDTPSPAPAPVPAANTSSSTADAPFAFAADFSPSSNSSSSRPRSTRHSPRSSQATTTDTPPPASTSGSGYRSPKDRPASNRLLYISIAGGIAALILGVVSVYIYLDGSRRTAEALLSKKKAADPSDTSADTSQGPADSPAQQTTTNPVPSNASAPKSGTPPQKNPSPTKKDTPAKDNPARSPSQADNTPPKTKGNPLSQTPASSHGPGQDPGPPPGATLLSLPRSVRTFTFAPAPKSAQLTDRVRHTLKLPVPSSAIRHFVPPANANTDDAFVVYQQPGGDASQPTRWVLERISPVGTRLVRLDWEDDRLWPLVAVHISEKQSLCLAAIQNRIRIWDLTSKEIIHESLDPFAGLPEAQAAGIAALYAVRDPQQFIVVATSGIAVVYDWSQGKVSQQFRPPQPQAGRVRWLQNTALDSEQQSWVIAIGGTLYHFRCDSQLTRLAQIPLGGDVQRSLALAAESGRFVYVLETGDASKRERVILFTTDQGENSFRLLRWPKEAGDPIAATWAEATAVIRTTRGVLLLEHDEGNLIPFALLQGEDGSVPYATTRGSSLWYLLPDSTNPQMSTLACSLTMPPDDYAQFAEQFSNEQPVPRLLLSPMGLKK